MMSNHLHLLVRGPHRPDGFDVPLDVLVAGLERALGETAAGALRKQLEFWRTTKNTLAIEEWRQRLRPDVLQAWASYAFALCSITTDCAIGRSLSEFNDRQPMGR